MTFSSFKATLILGKEREDERKDKEGKIKILLLQALEGKGDVLARLSNNGSSDG